MGNDCNGCKKKIKKLANGSSKQFSLSSTLLLSQVPYIALVSTSLYVVTAAAANSMTLKNSLHPAESLHWQ